VAGIVCDQTSGTFPVTPELLLAGDQSNCVCV